MDSGLPDPGLSQEHLEYDDKNFIELGRIWAQQQNEYPMNAPPVMASTGMASHGTDSSPVAYEQSPIPPVTSTNNTNTMIYSTNEIASNESAFVTDNNHYHEQSGVVPSPSLVTASAIRPTVFDGGDNFGFTPKYEDDGASSDNHRSSLASMLRSNDEQRPFLSAFQNLKLCGTSNLSTMISNVATSSVQNVFGSYSRPYQHQPISYSPVTDNKFLKIKTEFASDCSAFFNQQPNFTGPDRNVATFSNGVTSPPYNLAVSDTQNEQVPDYLASDNFNQSNVASNVASISAVGSEPNQFNSSTSTFSSRDYEQQMSTLATSTNNLIIETEDASDYLTLDRQQPIFTGPDRQMATVSTNSPQYNLAMSNTETEPNYYMAPNNIDQPNMPSVASTSAAENDNDHEDVYWLDRQGQRIPKVKMNFQMFSRRFKRFVRRGRPVPLRRRRAPARANNCKVVIVIDGEEDEIIISDDEVAVDHNEELPNENPPMMMVVDNVPKLAEQHSNEESSIVEHRSLTEDLSGNTVSSIGPSTSAGDGGEQIVRHNYGLRSMGNISIRSLNSTDESLLDHFGDLSPIFQSERSNLSSNDVSLNEEDVFAHLTCNAVRDNKNQFGGQQQPPPYPFLSSFSVFSQENQRSGHHARASSSPNRSMAIDAPSTSANTSTSYTVGHGIVTNGEEKESHFKRKFDQIHARLNLQEARKQAHLFVAASTSVLNTDVPQGREAVLERMNILKEGMSRFNKEMYKLKKALKADDDIKAEREKRKHTQVDNKKKRHRG